MAEVDMAQHIHGAGCGVCEELIDREQAARALADEATRAADEILLAFSHELRGRLNAITGWTEVLRGQLSSVGELAERAIGTIERNAWAQARVIDDMVAKARSRAEERVAASSAAHREAAPRRRNGTTGRAR
jgi:signal transduction histidine kinase